MKLACWIATLATLCSGAVAAERSGYQVAKTAFGHPDLQGVWTNATITTLERPAVAGGRAAVSAAEAAQWEAQAAAYRNADAGPSDPDAPALQAGDNVGGYNAFWIDPGSNLAKVGEEYRTSIITYPSDGKIPYRPATRQRLGQFLQNIRAGFAGPEQRPLGERCIVGFGSSGGPPMLPVLYNNHYQIVQNEDHVLIHVEMNHDARIVRLSTQRLPMDQWLGDSLGHWEEDTLVVVTRNFPPGQSCRASIRAQFCMSADATITERFTRISADEILYEFEVDDTSAFTDVWRGQLPLRKGQGPIYEYACHEGNYALPGILAGARKEASDAKTQ